MASDLRDAVRLLSQAVSCLTAAIATTNNTAHERLIREADICASDALRIADTVEVAS